MNTQELDRLATTITAFGSWAEMVESMNGGYAPTLRKNGFRGKAERKRDEDCEALAMAVVEHGYKFFDGRRIIGGNSKF